MPQPARTILKTHLLLTPLLVLMVIATLPTRAGWAQASPATNAPPKSAEPASQGNAPATAVLTPAVQQTTPVGNANTTVITEIHPAQRVIIKKDDGADPWVPGTNYWGSRGMQRLEAAHPVRTGSLVFALSHEMSITNNFFTTPDRNVYQAQRLYIMWAPLQGFEAGVSESLVTDSYHTFVDHTIQTLGNPMLNLKYSFSPMPHLGLGVIANLLVPSAAHSNGLVPRAFTVTPSLIGTYDIGQIVEVSLNVGYAYDQSSKLSASLAPEERFTFNQSSYSGIAYGLGVLGAINVADVVGIGPFAEVTGRFAPSLRFPDNPLRATGGVKVYLWENHLAELHVGGDYRIFGRPQAGMAYPGLPTWAFFAELSLHLFDHSKPQEIIIGNPPCNVDTDCAAGQTCRDHVCVIITEVVKEVVKEVQQETFTIAGKVLDAETGRPVLDASVQVKGFEKTPLSVDYKTGAFQSFPLAVGDGLIQVTASAPNYKNEDQAMARGKANEEKQLNFNLKRADKPAVGRVQGSLKDGKTGRAVAGGTVFIIALNQKIAGDEHGSFSAEVKAGRYDVLISAPKYITQRKKLIIHDGDVIILNVDLARGKH